MYAIPEQLIAFATNMCNNDILVLREYMKEDLHFSLIKSLGDILDEILDNFFTLIKTLSNANKGAFI